MAFRLDARDSSGCHSEISLSRIFTAYLVRDKKKEKRRVYLFFFFLPLQVGREKFTVFPRRAPPRLKSGGGGRARNANIIIKNKCARLWRPFYPAGYLPLRLIDLRIFPTYRSSDKTPWELVRNVVFGFFFFFFSRVPCLCSRVIRYVFFFVFFL